AQQANPLLAEDFEAQKKWVDSIYGQMTLKEKVGQLFMVQLFSNAPEKVLDTIPELIEEYHVGGIIFSNGGPVWQAELTNYYQKISKTPLLIAMDAEWGLAMRLDSTFAFPWNMTLGAIKNNELVREAGVQIGQHCKRLGVHINFAPVVDINTNPENPIIGNRSFGEDKENVTQKALAFMEGMHSQGILSSAKHFPGHGDTDQDSHKTLPTIGFSKKRLDSVELYPFKKLINNGVSSVMIAHLNVPALEPDNIPSSLSKKIVTKLLKKKLDFHGLVFTDALNMRGVADFDEPGEIDLAAFLAGNDILLISESVPKASKKIIEAYKKGIITEKRLAHSVRKILYAKYKVGLDDFQPIETTFLYEDLNNIHNKVLYHKLMENAATVIKNDKAILPVKNLEKKSIAYVHFGDADGTAFFDQLNKYADVDRVEAEHLDQLLEKLEAYNYVIVGFHKSNDNPWKSYKFTDKELVWLHEIARKNITVLNVFASPYALLDVPSFTNINGILISYQNSPVSQKIGAQILFGAIGAKGKLPVSIGQQFPAGTSYETKPLKRLAYGIPESVGMNSYKLRKIDSIMNYALEKEMTPGAQILVARKGTVIYQKSFGFQTYEKEIPITDRSIYDLASLTKILATLPLIMELEEQNVIDLNTKLKEILPITKHTNKRNITLKKALSHYARFQAWIPYYLSTMDPETGEPSKRYFRTEPMGEYNIKIADSFYMRNDMVDTVYQTIVDSDRLRKQEYVYSDLPYYLMKKYLENHYNSSLDHLTQEHFYESLGATRTGYLPLQKFDTLQIVPSEIDTLWRNQTVRGYVHDEGAAMLGGIGGHAGLFSNANDVAKIMQMYLNGGYYGGKRYFEEKTIEKFNTCYYCDEEVRRGVGFDKPQLEDRGPTCGCVPMESFGHSGFTGTYTWADPVEEIVYVFLSNRIFPHRSNKQLITEDIRTEIQRAIYEAIDYSRKDGDLVK
ncbi:MAG TPA: glycoside hydrolase family 3 N-terminal domain-containing protein, partial [Flavobacteriaceae bacterium]|nr:glycoside hydrolase family 3 N-terminal domain-containing protein [Flavobacteriaceae bacterium]